MDRIKQFFKEIVCFHIWKKCSSTDFCRFDHVWRDDRTRRRVTSWKCQECGKRRVTETMVCV